MAAGEYVSVSSQSDTEQADLARERASSRRQPESEREELAADLRQARARAARWRCQVADQLMAQDALGAHARDELGISEMTTARPVQAALSSAATFAVGAALPLLMVARASPAPARSRPVSSRRSFCSRCSAPSARTAGGAAVWRAALRVDVLGRAGDGRDGGDRQAGRHPALETTIRRAFGARLHAERRD